MQEFDIPYFVCDCMSLNLCKHFMCKNIYFWISSIAFFACHLSSEKCCGKCVTYVYFFPMSWRFIRLFRETWGTWWNSCKFFSKHRVFVTSIEIGTKKKKWIAIYYYFRSSSKFCWHFWEGIISFHFLVPYSIEWLILRRTNIRRCSPFRQNGSNSFSFFSHFFSYFVNNHRIYLK